MFERLDAEHPVEGFVRKRNLRYGSITSVTKRRRAFARLGRIDPGPAAATAPHEVARQGEPANHDFEHFLVRNIAEMRLDGGHYTFAQRGPEWH